ncbi:DNA polymerase III subunit beta [candidate division WOR-3 bacterium]|nr:DNA polymerase III subunit beta [candidate division WOR-3 bacterium]
MELKIEKSVLSDLLSKVHPIIPGKTTMTALSNILIEAKAGRVHITATDLETSVTAIGTAEIIAPGEIALNGKKLYDIVRELPACSLEFKVDNLVTTIQYKKGRFSMSGIEKEEYPKILTVAKEREVNIPYATLQRAVDKTLFAASPGDINAVLSGGLLDLQQDKVSLVATDGHRLALFRSNIKLGKIANLVIPNKVWKEIANFSSGIDIVFDETKVGFLSEDMTVASRLMEGEFPPYESVLPKDNDKLLIASKEEIISSLRRVLVFTPEISRLVKLIIKPGSLSVEATSEDGEAKEKISCKYEGQQLAIGYNGQYLLSMLSKIDSDEVQFAFKDPLSAVLITPVKQEEGEEITYLLMPIRLE